MSQRGARVDSDESEQQRQIIPNGPNSPESPVDRPRPYLNPGSAQPDLPYAGKPAPPSGQERALTRNAVLIASAMLVFVCLVCGLIGWMLGPVIKALGG